MGLTAALLHRLLLLSCPAGAEPAAGTTGKQGQAAETRST